MKKYDLTVLVRTDVKEGAKDSFADRMEKTVKALEGKVAKVTEMGKKQLAYRIQGVTEANFVNFTVELPPEAVLQLDRKLTIDKEVLRHLLVVTV